MSQHLIFENKWEKVEAGMNNQPYRQSQKGDRLIYLFID